MQLPEAIELIRDIKLNHHHPQVWADVGCGGGLFTRALAALLSKGSTVYAVDKFNSLSAENIPGRTVIFQQADFEKDEWLVPKLDGILMANSLHYVQDQKTFIGQLLHKLNMHNASLVFVEYDMHTANPWVPYPLSFAKMKQLIETLDLPPLQKLGERKSIYHRANMYASQMLIPG